MIGSSGFCYGTLRVRVNIFCLRRMYGLDLVLVLFELFVQFQIASMLQRVWVGAHLVRLKKFIESFTYQE